MLKQFWVVVAAVLFLMIGCGVAFALPQTMGSPRVIKAAHHDLSPPLATVRWYLPPLLRSVVQGRNPSRERLRELQQKLIESGLLNPVQKQSAASSRAAAPPALSPPRSAHDTVLQRGLESPHSGSFTNPILNFDGLGFADAATVAEPIEYTPADANTAVGMNYVVEVVNALYAVYDKSDGSRVLGPMRLANLWAGFGQSCGRKYTNLRHATVLFDQLAQRWVISVAAIYNSAYCVAVSRTSDPTGEYFRYEFDNLPPRFSPIHSDKMGLWPNAYLVTMDMTDYIGHFRAENFVALDRRAMLRGEPTTMLVWSLPKTAQAYGDLPVSLDGFKLPPANEPALFANYVSPNLFGARAPYALALWKLELDWNDPRAALLTGPFLIDVPPFNDMLCGNAGECIPQPDPGIFLDAVSDRLMYRLAYRNFGDHEALVTNQTVTANAAGAPPAGIRWYELETTAPGAGDWSIKQSGTFDPADGNSRWVGSIAMDASGDMALGYSLSGPRTPPSVVYTGRAAGDPAGEMTQAETTLVVGGGVQQQSFDWGAFSSMAVDPADGCTFWYANAYYPATGAYRWNTRIGEFRFAGCEPVSLGALRGTVTDAATGATISGAEIVVSPGLVTTYSEAGHYQFGLPPGDYTANVFDFGYDKATVRFTITGGRLIAQNFALQAAPTASLSGQVTDAVHGYGLYAEVRITTRGIGQVANVWTDPATGAYSVDLPKGITYTLSVMPYQDGFSVPVPTPVTLDNDAVRDFALGVGTTCSAPGYEVSSGFGEDFNGRFPPLGWSLGNGVSGSPVVWNSNSYWGDPNWTGGSGSSAEINSGVAVSKFGYTGGFDGTLITPPIAVSAISVDPILQFRMNYAHFDSGDRMYLYILPSGGRSWIQVTSWEDSVGTPFGLPGQVERINLAPYIPARTATIQLLWRYQSYRGDKWYSQIDDVVIGACKPVDGGLVSGRVIDSNTDAGVMAAVVSDDRGDTVKVINNPADSRLASGSYALFAPAGRRGLSVSAPGYAPGSANVTIDSNATVAQDFALGAGRLAPAPSTVEVHVPVNGELSKSLSIENKGTAAAHYRLAMLNAPAATDHAQHSGSLSATPVYEGRGQVTQTRATQSWLWPTAKQTANRDFSSPASASSPSHAGDVVATFTAGFRLLGLGVDRDAHDLWLGNIPANVFPGVQNDLEDHRYLFNGTDTGDSIDVSNPDVLYMADMAYDDVTGMLWQISVDQPAHFGDVVAYSHIHELDPKSMMPTGKSILIPSAQAEFGLAFDPLSTSWYAGDFNSEAIYHFDATGVLLDAVRVGLPISGLAYNSATGHLFVLTQGGDHAVYVLDAKHGYAPVTTFDIPGFNPQNSGAGFGYDCAGHLWVSDYADREVFEVVSGETGWCAIKHIPWLTVTPSAGTLAAGASVAVTLDFNGAGQPPYTTSQAQLKLSGTTPYPVRTIPLVVHWDPQPVNLAITGSVAPGQVGKGSAVVYNLTVENRNADTQGSATQTVLTYPLPAGASYVSGAGDGVVCSAPPSGSSATPATAMVSCSLGTLTPGAAKTVTVVVEAELAGTLSSTFTVSAREPGSASATTSIVLTSTVLGVADVNTMAQNVTVGEGKTGTLRFTVANAGPDTATDTTFKLGPGANAKLISAQSSQGRCQAGSGGGFQCNLGNLDPGGAVTVVVSVYGTYAGSTTVTGQAGTSATDPNNENDAAQATVTVAANSGEKNNAGGSGGGGSFALFVLVVLLGFVSTSLVGRHGSGVGRIGGFMIKGAKTFLSVAMMAALVTLIGIGLASIASPAQARTPETAHAGLRAGLTASGIAMAQRDLASGRFRPMSLQSVPMLLKQAALVGAHDPASNIHLTVSLKLRNIAKLKQFLQALHDPRSPSYLQFLTPAEFTVEYGPTRAQVAAVEKYLQGYGIKVKNVSANRLLIHTQGTTVAYENALGLQISDYRMNKREFFSTTDQPKLPVAIADFVQNVIGLNNAARLRPMSHIASLPTAGNIFNGHLAQRISSSATPAPPAQSSAYYNPLQIRTAYDWPSITASDNGSGVTIAILTAMSSNLQRDDYAGFWEAFGLPDHTVNIIKVDGDRNDDRGMVETLLDVEWSGAMAPGADLDVYVGADPALSTFIDVYNRFVNDNNAQVMTTSWGAPEASWGALAQTADNIFAQAAAQGISMFAAAGDHGAADGTGSANMADFPSVDPYVTAANGTVLYADAAGNYLSETAWSDSGGAISQVFSRPSWQTGAGVPQNDWRNNSDLAMNAGPTRPYVLRFNGQWGIVWGTSAVAPQLAGLFAIGVWQHGGRSLGQSNELIYADVNADASHYASDFHDVTTGSNGAYEAGINWDHPTGWGSPKASSLLAHLGIQGPVGTLTGTITEAGSGNLLANAKVTVTPGNISRITSSDGSYLILLAPGTYTVTVSDYGYRLGTASVTITDGNTTIRNFSLQLAPMATITGRIKDGSGHGYGLYAEIKVTSPGFGQVADVWSKPTDGSYSVSVPEGFDYSFSVATALNGYDAGSWTALDLRSAQAHDFVLNVSAACTAPGYHFERGFGEDFNSGVPPVGWTSSAVSLVRWKSTGNFFNSLPNWSGGSGQAAAVNAGGTIIQNHSFDAQLITPPIPVTSLPPSPALSFLVNYQHTLNDALDVDVSGDGGRTWTTMAHIAASYGNFKATPGAQYSLDLGNYIPPRARSIQIRWRFINPVDYIGNYAEVDDVSIGACKVLDGGLVFGQVVDANTDTGVVGAMVSDDQGNRVATITNPADPAFPIGGYLLFAPAGERSLTATDYNYADASAHVNVASGAVVTQNLALKSGRLTPSPASLDVEITVGGTSEKTFAITNSGQVSAQFRVRKIDMPVVGPAAAAVRLGSASPISSETDDRRNPAALTATSIVAGSGAGSPLAKPTASPSSQTAGAVIATFRTGIPAYSLGVDHDAGDLWIGSPVFNGGDDADHRYLFDGTGSGGIINVAFADAYFMADMAYDDNTGKLWQLSVPKMGTNSCLHELDTVTRQPTGKKICPPFPAYQIGLAYDPVGNTWVTGDFNSRSLYQVNSRGEIIGSAQIGIQIEGLAYNPGTGHLFVLTTGGHHAVYVYDVTKGFLTPPAYFDVPGFNQQNSGAGFGYDCDGHLWIADEVDNEVFEVASGETGWCAIKHVPWLTIAPAAGTLGAGDSAAVTLAFDGANQKAFSTSQVQLKLSGTTPYPVTTIPVTVHWAPQPVDLVLSGTAAPTPVRKGNGLVYSLVVKNTQEAGYGAATETELTYNVPVGVSYVSGSGDGVTCTAPAVGSKSAPAAATSATNTVTCGLGTLAPGATKVLTIAVTASMAGKLASTFHVGAREPDSDSGSNTLALDAEVLGTADIGVSTSNAKIKAGSSATVQFEVTNAGPDTATGIVFKGGSVGEIRLQSASSDAGNCALLVNNTIDCNLDDMSAGGMTTVTITAFGVYTGTASITGQVTTSASDSNPDNNLGHATIEVISGSERSDSRTGSGGGGGLGWPVLAVLLGLGLVGVHIRRRRLRYPS